MDIQSKRTFLFTVLCPGFSKTGILKIDFSTITALSLYYCICDKVKTYDLRLLSSLIIENKTKKQLAEENEDCISIPEEALYKLCREC